MTARYRRCGHGTGLLHVGDVDQEADDRYLQGDDPEGRADLEGQYADAVRA
ncbi:hypothetical protein [Streptomyces sp. CA2R101]|uniref:hypothetical protein n=1 Tax=Streptomyces sp. CA2R101 TaxID=3120152 RepID=UPI00300A66C4